MPAPAAAAIEDSLRLAGRGEEADAREAARLESAPPGIGATVELATMLCRRGELGRAGEVLAERLPEGVMLTSAQSAPLLEAAELAAREAANGDADAAVELALVDRVVASSPVSPPTMHGVRIIFLLAADEPPMERLLEAAVTASRQHPDAAEAFYETVAARLAQTDGNRAVEFLARAVADAERAMGEPNPLLYRRWVLWAVSVGTPEDAVNAVRTAIERGMDKFILEPVDPASALPPSPAELAYQLGVFVTAGANGRDETSVAMYELALEHDPAHTWAANNLGYLLLERDGPTERAAELIESAYRALPGASSVVDSLGWLRYKQGVLRDVKDAEGNVERMGAVSLLVRASELVEHQNPVISDHLGDAFWMMGDRRSATQQWRLAGQQARQRIEGSRRQGEEAGSLTRVELQRLNALIRSTQAKQTAASRGRTPAVAPIPGEMVPNPPRDADEVNPGLPAEA